MGERLHICMSCVKPWNIPTIAPSLLQCDPHPWAIRWHIMQQDNEPDPKGFHKANEALDWIKDGWVWTPSDDSLHYPNLFQRAAQVRDANPNCKVMVFSEDRGVKEGNRIMRASADNIKPCEVDGSQIIASREFIGDLRYPYPERAGIADGHFAMQLYQKDPAAFVFVDEVLVRFNSLDP